MNSPARRRAPNPRGSITADAPLCEGARWFEMNTDAIGIPSAPKKRRGLADGAVRRFEGCRWNHRPAWTACHAPTCEGARLLEADTAVLKTTRMRGAARCSSSSFLRVIRDSSSPVCPTIGAHPRPSSGTPAADGCSALLGSGLAHVQLLLIAGHRHRDFPRSVGLPLVDVEMLPVRLEPSIPRFTRELLDAHLER